MPLQRLRRSPTLGIGLYSLSGAQLFATPWIVICQAPLSMGFSRQEHWSGLPFPSPGDLPNPRTEPSSPTLAGRFFTTEPPGKPLPLWYFGINTSFSVDIHMSTHWVSLSTGLRCYYYCQVSNNPAQMLISSPCRISSHMYARRITKWET